MILFLSLYKYYVILTKKNYLRLAIEKLKINKWFLTRITKLTYFKFSYYMMEMVLVSDHQSVVHMALFDAGKRLW